MRQEIISDVRLFELSSRVIYFVLSSAVVHNANVIWEGASILLL